MINEFNSSHQRVFRVNPQLGGALDVSVDAAVVIRPSPRGESPSSPALSGAITDDVGNTFVADDDTVFAALSRYVRRLYAPSASEITESQPLLNFTSWYTVHAIYRGAASALAIRTLLLAARVNGTIANLLSPCLSLLVQRVLRQHTPRALTRTHRLVRDPPLKSSIFYGGIAGCLLNVLEVLLASGSLGRTRRSLVLAIAAALALATVSEVAPTQVSRYVAGECGLGFPSLPSRLLLRSLAREYREGCEVFAGMTGLVSCLAVPRDAAVTWTVLFSAAAAFASTQAARSVVDRCLTAERLEKCLHTFVQSMDASGHLMMLNETALSMTHITGEESLVTPPLPWIHDRVPITFGDSFYATLHAAPPLTTSQKMHIVQEVEGCLATRGVALVYNQHANTYHVLFSGRLMPGPISDKSMLGIPSGGLLEVVPRFPMATPLAMKELWAYFYAYVHYSSGCRVVTSAAASAQAPSNFHLLSSLGADGTLDPSAQIMSPFDFSLSRADAQQLVAEGRLDPLYPQFLSFVDALVMGGWRVDHIRLPSEGWGVAVHYL